MVDSVLDVKVVEGSTRHTCKQAFHNKIFSGEVKIGPKKVLVYLQKQGVQNTRHIKGVTASLPSRLSLQFSCPRLQFDQAGFG